MASLGGEPNGERRGGEPAPLGHPGTRWEGRRADPEPAPAPDVGRSRGLRRPAAEVDPVVLAAPGVLRIAGRERPLGDMRSRVAAYVLDLLTIFVGLVIIAGVFGGSMEAPDPNSPDFNDAASGTYLIGVVFQVGFYWVWNSLGWSPGKRLLGLRIVNDRGAAPGAGRGFARTVAPMLAGVVSGMLAVVFAVALPPELALLLGMTPLYLNYLWPLWDTRRQTWHDKLASTYVVKAEADGSEHPAGASPDRTSR